MHVTFTQGGGPVRYTVEHRGGCVLVFGNFPLDALKPLSGLAPKKAVIDPDVARMAGANVAFGLRTDLDKLRAELGSAAEQREAHKPQNRDLSPNAIKWLGSGQRGISSNTLFTVLTGVDALGDWDKSHPHDPDDLRRCRLLLDACPEIAVDLPRMEAESKAWAALVSHWAELCALMDTETPNWRDPDARGSAPRTYALMKTLINAAGQ